MRIKMINLDNNMQVLTQKIVLVANDGCVVYLISKFNRRSGSQNRVHGHIPLTSKLEKQSTK